MEKSHSLEPDLHLVKNVSVSYGTQALIEAFTRICHCSLSLIR
jgi:hypothetical protein